MKENKLSITIEQPASSVFDFTTEPDNTPLWIDSIESEKVNERPIKVGTLYTNVDKDGNSNTYEVTKFVEGGVFELKSVSSSYTVQYTYSALSLSETELEYYEWVEDGDPLIPFEQKHLDKLKAVLEKSQA